MMQQRRAVLSGFAATVSAPRALALGRNLNLVFGSGCIVMQAASGNRNKVVVGGNQRLPEAIARWLDQLGRITIDPPLPLPPLHRETTAKVPYMAMRQVPTIADSPSWASAGPPSMFWTDGPLGVLSANRFGASDDKKTSFDAWTRGAIAERLDAGPASDAERLVLGGVSQAGPAARGRLRITTMHSRTRAPWQNGASAVCRPRQATRQPRAVGHERRVCIGQTRRCEGFDRMMGHCMASRGAV